MRKRDQEARGLPVLARPVWSLPTQHVCPLPPRPRTVRAHGTPLGAPRRCRLLVGFEEEAELPVDLPMRLRAPPPVGAEPFRPVRPKARSRRSKRAFA